MTHRNKSDDLRVNIASVTSRDWSDDLWIPTYRKDGRYIPFSQSEDANGLTSDSTFKNTQSTDVWNNFGASKSNMGPPSTVPRTMQVSIRKQYNTHTTGETDNQDQSLSDSYQDTGDTDKESVSPLQSSSSSSHANQSVTKTSVVVDDSIPETKIEHKSEISYATDSNDELPPPPTPQLEVLQEIDQNKKDIKQDSEQHSKITAEERQEKISSSLPPPPAALTTSSSTTLPPSHSLLPPSHNNNNNNNPSSVNDDNDTGSHDGTNGYNLEGMTKYDLFSVPSQELFDTFSYASSYTPTASGSIHHPYGFHTSGNNSTTNGPPSYYSHSHHKYDVGYPIDSPRTTSGGGGGGGMKISYFPSMNSMDTIDIHQIIHRNSSLDLFFDAASRNDEEAKKVAMRRFFSTSKDMSSSIDMHMLPRNLPATTDPTNSSENKRNVESTLTMPIDKQLSDKILSEILSSSKPPLVPPSSTSVPSDESTSGSLGIGFLSTTVGDPYHRRISDGSYTSTTAKHTTRKHRPSLDLTHDPSTTSSANPEGSKAFHPTSSSSSSHNPPLPSSGTTGSSSLNSYIFHPTAGFVLSPLATPSENQRSFFGLSFDEGMLHSMNEAILAPSFDIGDHTETTNKPNINGALPAAQLDKNNYYGGHQLDMNTTGVASYIRDPNTGMIYPIRGGPLDMRRDSYSQDNSSHSKDQSVKSRDNGMMEDMMSNNGLSMGGNGSGMFRGKYKCGRCGQPKVNHDCEYTLAADMVSVGIQTRVELPSVYERVVTVSKRKSIQEEYRNEIDMSSFHETQEKRMRAYGGGGGGGMSPPFIPSSFLGQMPGNPYCMVSYPSGPEHQNTMMNYPSGIMSEGAGGGGIPYQILYTSNGMNLSHSPPLQSMLYHPNGGSGTLDPKTMRMYNTFPPNNASNTNTSTTMGSSTASTSTSGGVLPDRSLYPNINPRGGGYVSTAGESPPHTSLPPYSSPNYRLSSENNPSIQPHPPLRSSSDSYHLPPHLPPSSSVLSSLRQSSTSPCIPSSLPPSYSSSSAYSIPPAAVYTTTTTTTTTTTSPSLSSTPYISTSHNPHSSHKVESTSPLQQTETIPIVSNSSTEEDDFSPPNSKNKAPIVNTTTLSTNTSAVVSPNETTNRDSKSFATSTHTTSSVENTQKPPLHSSSSPLPVSMTASASASTSSSTTLSATGQKFSEEEEFIINILASSSTDYYDNRK